MSDDSKDSVQVDTFPGARYWRSMQGSVDAILIPLGIKRRVISMGYQFVNYDRWTAEVFARLLCTWWSKNQTALPTTTQLNELMREANAYRCPDPHIRVARMPERVTYRLALGIVGGGYHEAWHTKYSKRDRVTMEEVQPILDIAEQVILAGGAMDAKMRGLLMTLHHLIEDIRIERRGNEDFEGAIQAMRDLQDFILDLEHKGRAQGAKVKNVTVTNNARSILLCCFRDLGLGYNTHLSRQTLQFYKDTAPGAVAMLASGGLLHPMLHEAKQLSREDGMGSLRVAMKIVVELWRATQAEAPEEQGGMACPSCGAGPKDLIIRSVKNEEGMKIKGLAELECKLCGYKMKFPLPDKSLDLNQQEQPKEEPEEQPEVEDLDEEDVGGGMDGFGDDTREHIQDMINEGKQPPEQKESQDAKSTSDSGSTGDDEEIVAGESSDADPSGNDEAKDEEPQNGGSAGSSEKDAGDDEKATTGNNSVDDEAGDEDEEGDDGDEEQDASGSQEGADTSEDADDDWDEGNAQSSSASDEKDDEGDGDDDSDDRTDSRGSRGDDENDDDSGDDDDEYEGDEAGDAGQYEDDDYDGDDGEDDSNDLDGDDEWDDDEDDEDASQSNEEGEDGDDEGFKLEFEELDNFENLEEGDDEWEPEENKLPEEEFPWEGEGENPFDGAFGDDRQGSNNANTARPEGEATPDPDDEEWEMGGEDFIKGAGGPNVDLGRDPRSAMKDADDVWSGDEQDGAMNNQGAIQQALQEEQEKHLRDRKYGEQVWNPYNPMLDDARVVRTKDQAKDMELAQKMLKEVRQTVTYLRTRLRVIVKAQEMTDTVHGVRRGRKLSDRRLVDTAIDIRSGAFPKRAYQDSETQTDTSLSLAICLDQSGSMTRTRREVAKCMMAMIDAVDGIRGKSFAFGFRNGDHGTRGDDLPNDWERIYHRVRGVRYDVFKTWDETFGHTKWRFAHTQATGSTPMADGLQFGLQALNDRPEAHRVLAVITDGVPDSPHEKVIRRQIRIAREAGIHVIGIGIGDGAEYVIPLFGPDNAVWESRVEDLPNPLLKKLNELCDFTGRFRGRRAKLDGKIKRRVS